MSHPPLQNSLKLRQDHDHCQVHDRDADVGHEGLVGLGLDLLRRLGQVRKSDDRDKGGVLEQRDQLIAESGQDVLDRLRDDDILHDGDVIHAEAAPRFHLSGIDRHDAAPYDLRSVGAGVDAQREDRDADKVAAGPEDNEPHDQQLYHHRCSADHCRIELAELVDDPEKNTAVRAPLLVMKGADHGDKDPEDDADAQRAERHSERRRRYLPGNAATGPPR